MKRLLFGLLVAVVALSASAFTTIKTGESSKHFTTIWITGKQLVGATPYYTFATSNPGTTCEADESPCQISNTSAYTTLPTSAPFRFPVADYTAENFLTQSEQPQLANP